MTIPVAVLKEAGLQAGDHVLVEALEKGEMRIRRGAASRAPSAAETRRLAEFLDCELSA